MGCTIDLLDFIEISDHEISEKKASILFNSVESAEAAVHEGFETTGLPAEPPKHENAILPEQKIPLWH